MNSEFKNYVQKLIDIYNIKCSEKAQDYYDPVLLELVTMQNLRKGHITNKKFRLGFEGFIPIFGEFDHWFGSIIENKFLNQMNAIDNNNVDFKNPYIFLEDEKYNRIKVIQNKSNYNIPNYTNVKIENQIISIPNQYDYWQIIKEISIYDGVLIAFLIKTLHYLFFKKYNYDYLFTTIGIENASLLKEFYIQNKLSCNDNKIKNYWLQQKTFVLLVLNDTPIKFCGLCYKKNRMPFAIGVIVKINSKMSALILSIGDTNQIDKFYDLCNKKNLINSHLVEIDFGKNKIIIGPKIQFQIANKNLAEQKLDMQLISI